jgi:hypothetical protein
MRVLGALLLPVAVLLPAAYVGHRLSEDRPAPVRPTGVVWAGRVFVDRASLDRWLRARGGSYDVWAARHPKLAWPTTPVTRQAQASRPGTGHLMLGGLLALAAGVVLALTVASPPRGLVRLASRRGPPELVWRGSLARSQAVAGGAVRETPSTSRLLTSARAMPSEAAYALHRIRRNHPQVGWYAAAGLLAAAVGVLVPYSLH